MTRRIGEKIIPIDSPYFCAAVFVDGATGIVHDAAPILRYMVGWHEQKVRIYMEQKGWSELK